MYQNICHFIPARKNDYTLNAINFVLETTVQLSERLRTESVYKMYYVCSGSGAIHTLGKINLLKKGDMFFTFPGSPYAIESKENFTYMYVSFIGRRGNMLMENLKISSTNFIFHNVHGVYDFWEKCITLNVDDKALIAESVLLYSFAFLAGALLPRQNDAKQNQNINLIKKYIDDHFSEHDFSLEKMGKELSYNPKYISHIFKKQFHVGIVEYLNTIRVQNACAMIEQGFTSVTDIADHCGFADAQYFSKVFKAQTGHTPTQYMKTL